MLVFIVDTFRGRDNRILDAYFNVGLWSFCGSFGFLTFREKKWCTEEGDTAILMKRLLVSIKIILWEIDKPPEEGHIIDMVYLYFNSLNCTGIKGLNSCIVSSHYRGMASGL